MTTVAALAGLLCLAAAASADTAPTAISGATPQAAPGCPPETPELLWASLPEQARAADLGAMIGQLLVTSFTGKAPGDPGVERAIAALADGRIGGVLFFRHNVGTAAQVRAVNHAFATAHPALPAFIAVDQEGGAVARLTPAEGVPRLPSARALARRPLAEARDRFAATAEGLAALGFTLNLAPVVDLAANPDNPVIGRYNRAFSADPDTVVAYAAAFVDAHRAAGVATAIKHFPGHGSSTGDTHHGFVDISGTWSEAEIAPFAHLIAAGRADMVMAGHLLLDAFHPDTGETPPATLSRPLLTDLLRNRLCFDGLILSDDLNMQAISDQWPMAEAIVAALRAGVDVVVASVGGDGDVREVDGIVRSVTAAAAADPALATAIRHAYARVVHFKLDRAAGAEAPRRARPDTPLFPVLPVYSNAPAE